MAAVKTVLRTLPRCTAPRHAPSRSFFDNPLAGTSSLTASRTVPYSAPLVYAIISDIDSYSRFLPFCKSSQVTKWSSPDRDGHKWPEEASLSIGFNNDLSESFVSRVYCVPGQTVEAVSGPDVETALPAAAIAHHSPRHRDTAADPSRRGDVLAHIRTTWSLKAVPFKPGPVRAGATPLQLPAQHHTEVVLGVEYRFANPLYAVMGGAAAPKVAEFMVEAFEKRVREVLQKPSHGEETRVVRG